MSFQRSDRKWGIGAVFLAAALLGLSLRAEAASPERWASLTETVFQNYSREEGLPPLLPTALAQDGDGFLWIGTQGGLVRWDGYRFREYYGNSADPYALPSGWIQAVHSDIRGRLWIGMDANGLARYDRDQDRFISFLFGPLGSPSDHIGALDEDGVGGLWVGTDAGLYHLDAQAVAAPDLKPGDLAPPRLPGDKIQAILLDREKRLWVGTERGLFRQMPGSDALERVSVEEVPAGGELLVSALFEDGEGRIWIGTTQHGLFSVAPDGRDAKLFAAWKTGERAPGNDRISAIAAMGQEIWVAVRAGGIVAVDPSTNRTRRIRHDRLVSGSLAHDDVWTLLRDRSGSMWVGGSGGLSYHPIESGAVQTLFGDTTRTKSISDPDPSAILSARDGRIWLGFLSGGVDILDPVAGRVARLAPASGNAANALPQDLVTDMAEAGNGDVYVATARGVYRAAQDGQVALVQPLGRDPHAFTRTLLIDGAMLWIGGLDGLWSMKLEGGAARHVSDRSVLALLRDPKDGLWVGTRSGLERLDLATGTQESVLAEGAAGIVCSLLYDRQGRLWVGTFGGGVAVMTGQAQFRWIRVAEGLPHANVDRLLLDDAGLVWASTDDGLAVIDPTDFKVRSIQRAEGAALSFYWVKSGATDLEGEPLFGAKGGVSVIRPGWPADWNLPAPVVVSGLWVAGVPVPGSRFNGGGSPEPLVLTPETNSVTVEFAALDFTGPARNRYAYRLDGFDRNWSQTDAARRLATYTNLPPGDYVLRLRGSNRDGISNSPDLTIPLRVLPAWYQRLWVRIAITLAAATMLLLGMTIFIRRRTAYLHRRQGELERQIETRTADLRAANERLLELATTDPLTGCANRRYFMERGQELVRLGLRGMTLSMAVMDLDHFKLINDRYGHPIGDEVLRLAALTSQAHIRATDLIGRIGGEEFAILMPHTAAAAAEILADRLREALAHAETEAGDAKVKATASIGIAEQRAEETLESLYARADAALYAAKQNGRNRVVLAPD